MAFSTVRELAKMATEKKELNPAQQSSENYLLYGSNGKSTIASSLSDLVEEPILILSPANASGHLSEQFPNAIYYAINNLAELTAIIADLGKNMEIIKKIKNNLPFEARILQIKEEFLKEYEKSEIKKAEEDWKECIAFAKKGTFPISAIVLEEIDMISGWIQDTVEAKMNVVVAGQDKKNMGADWNELKSVIMDYYSRLLKLPIRTIFCTSDKLPTEKQGLTQIVPSICVGAANRLLLNLIGNVFYISSDKGKYTARLVGNKDIFIKSKFIPITYSGKIEEELNITGNPSLFWTYINEIKNTKLEENTKK